MQEIYIFKDGKAVSATFERMFNTHGPHLIEGKRLDYLSNVQILVDSSTSTVNQTGISESSAKTGSMLGRAVVGGVLLGGTAAAVGALSGKRESLTKGSSKEVLHTELTVELSFSDNSTLYVLLKTMESFHLILSYVNRVPLTESELKIEQQFAEKKRNKREQEKEKRKLVAKQSSDAADGFELIVTIIIMISAFFASTWLFSVI